MFRIPTLKIVELGTISESVVAILSRKSKDIDVVRSAGTFRGVWNEELGTTSEENINSWA